jgi:RES domain-containing protein
MKIFRIALTKFCDASGEGAKRYGGRWNLPGYPALYGCNTVAAALLERLTIDSELFSSERYMRYSVMEFLCDDSLLYIPIQKELPNGWDSIPFTKVSQEFGTAQLKQGTVCFVVPSVVDVTSLNAVINPTSNHFSKIRWKVYPLTLDQRIVR